MAVIVLSQLFVKDGGSLVVKVSNPKLSKYGQLQVDIWDVGSRTRSLRMSTGSPPRMSEVDVGEIDVPVGQLGHGLYEIRLVRLHGPLEHGLAEQVDLLSGRDYQRSLFEVGEIATFTTDYELLVTAQVMEKKQEEQFLQPVDIRHGVTLDGSEFTCFVFVRDVLIGTHIRLEHFEIMPTGGGLDCKDATDFVNEFLQEKTPSGIQFVHGDDLQKYSRKNNPVFIVHFPTILATSVDEVRIHCADQTRRILLALALTRDAGGQIFEIVVIDRLKPHATKFSVGSSYAGNLLVGQLSGESAEGLESYLCGLKNNPMDEFLVGLYKEARHERSHDFQYVRFWQIIETMAEGENYNSQESLRNYEGNDMLDNGHPLHCHGSVNIVFRLLCEQKIGSTEGTWKKVNVWFALRNAVAHHGSLSSYENLSRERVKIWARIGYQEIVESGGHDSYLWELKEDIKLLLMRRLVVSSRGIGSAEE